jgi:hypothetical protein
LAETNSLHVHVMAGPSRLEQLRSRAVADAYARFARACGAGVVLSVSGSDDSVDSPPEADRDAQEAFRVLLDSGAVYRDSNGRWLLRVGPYLSQADREAGGVVEAHGIALDRQTAALGRVEGVEVEVRTLDGRTLTAFTPHADALDRVAFVALSPNLPGVADWLADPALASQLDARPVDLVETGTSVQVPDVEGLVPVVASSSVDDRFGATAVLGVPDRDDIDSRIAASLSSNAAAAWKVRGVSGEPRPAVRYRAADVPISEPDGGVLKPIDLLVCGPDATDRVLRRRLIARALHDAGLASGLETGEPFARILMHAGVRTGDPGPRDAADPAPEGRPDAERVAALHGAAARKPLPWSPALVAQCQALLDEVGAYAKPRVQSQNGAAHDLGLEDPLRRRLVVWCRVAQERITDDIETLQMHRATRNLTRLFTRIQDFERRALETRHSLDDADREAQRDALLLLVRMLAPMAPDLAEDLWAAAGHDTPVSAIPWPEKPTLPELVAA